MIAEEKQAKDLIKKHLGRDAPSYQELKSLKKSSELKNPYTGFMAYYLYNSKNDEKMTTSADYDVTMTLAKCDQPRDYKNLNNFMSC